MTAVYRQKSKIFLWPLLGIERQGFPQFKTYLRDKSNKDYIIIAPFPKSNFSGEDKLFANENFLSFYETEHELVYIFTLEKWKEDYDKIINGKYSTLSPGAKALINRYWSTSQRGVLTPNPRVSAYLNPTEKIYLQVSKELEISFEDVVKGIEILEPPNLEKETFNESKDQVSTGSDTARISD